MKRLISLILTVTMVISLAPSAFAATSDTPISPRKTQSGILGNILYENTISTSTPDDNISIASASSNTTDIIVSFVDNSDGSVTIYEYHNNELSQFHTTVPGSGILYSTYINDDGSSDTKTTITKAQNNNDITPRSSSARISNYTSTQSNINNPTSVRTLGFMHYRNTLTNTTFSIDCEIIERYHPNETYTFNENTGGEISFWVGSVLSVLMLGASEGALLADKIVQKFITYGLIALGLGTTYFGVGSHTIRCNWYEQEIHGTPTAPSGRGKDIYLSGIYAFVNYGNGDEVETEGYTARDWGNPSMGRWMMYNVFGIDESPTSWTGLNRILQQ